MEESETSPILSVHISGHEHHCFNVCMCGKLEYFKLLMVIEHGVENQPDTFLYQWSVVTCHIISLQA